jgi:anti-sigma B factor antagonist
VVPAPSSTGTPVGPSLAVSVDVPLARVSVAGELDRESAHHLLDALTVLTARPGRRWRLDAAGVTFCDAGGVRALGRAHALATAHGRTLQFERTSRSVDRLVELVGHERLFPAPTQRRAGGTPGWARRIGCGTTGAA